MEELNKKLRSLPGIDSLLAAAGCADGLTAFPRAVLVDALRKAVEIARSNLKEQRINEILPADIIEYARLILAQEAQPSLKQVINATGVVLHTNLGRAPLSERARARVNEVMAGYSTLEYNVIQGERGSRYSHVAGRICSLTGAEAAIVVNNNAAAVLLVLSALGAGREVIVSRGQLVEIGGSFRIPDVMRQSGARLAEVGTTNKTHLYDYEQAISPDTAAILKVHTSNYRIIGFTHQPADSELVALAKQHELPVIEDLGSGTLLPLAAGGLNEPTVAERLAAGMDIVTFSGDKLFGGAQAGIIAGKKKYLALMEKHPLLRAIRIDKLSLAALEGTLIDYALGDPKSAVPVQRMLNASADELATAARQLAAELKKSFPQTEITAIATKSQTGGGALPGVDIDSFGVAVKGRRITAAALEKKLRRRSTPVIVRIQDERVILDVRCLSENDWPEIRAALAEALEGE